MDGMSMVHNHVGSIQVTNSRINLSNSTFENNSAISHNQTNFYAQDCDLNIMDSNFINNSFPAGGVFHFHKTFETNTSGCSFLHNHAEKGVLVTDNFNRKRRSIDFHYCSFRNNSAETCGGALFVHNTTIFLDSCDLNTNQVKGAQNGQGGGIFASHSSVTVRKSTVSHNSAQGYGGGIYTEGSTLTITTSTVNHNSAYCGGEGDTLRSTCIISSGGGIGTTSSTLTITNSTVNHNSADSTGGIYAYHSTLTITNSTVDHNSAKV